MPWEWWENGSFKFRLLRESAPENQKYSGGTSMVTWVSPLQSLIAEEPAACRIILNMMNLC